ncbi:DDB1 and CUL4 associated factor 4-like 2 [Podila verticillata]|nr:DDB1 and CUL4 associated factor 4-like 2 [Podila verticillata]
MSTGNKEKKKPWKHYRAGGGGGGGAQEGGANYSHHARQTPTPSWNGKHDRHGAPHQPQHHHRSHANSLKRTRDTQDNTSYRAQQLRQHQQHTTTTAPSAPPSTVSQASSTPTLSAVEIPGFYYDTEKKKYFKIAAGHLVKSQHPFSRDTIAERTRQKPVLDPIVQSTRKRFDTGAKGRNQSPYGDINWLLSDRQLGRAGPKHQLCEMHSILVKRWKKNRDMDPVVTSGANYTHMHVVNDASGRRMYVGSSRGALWRHTVSTDPEHQHMGFHWLRLGFESGSEVTSLHRTTDDHLITTYLGNMEKSGCLKIQKEAAGVHAMPTDALVYAPKKSNIWTSDYNGGKIALGADQKVVVINDWKSSVGQPGIECLWTGSDVFSVAIEPLGQSMIYAGCRNGSVRIYDLNQPRGTIPSNAAAFKKTQRQGSVFNGIGHKESSVSFLKRVSDHLLVTLAMNGEMSMWDTRFVGSSMFGGSVSFEGGPQEAKPVIQFRSPVQDQFSKSRFDVSADGSLLVAENIDNHLSVWSLRTGDRIHDLKLDDGPVGCMQFSDDQASGVYVAIADRIQYWGT